jgi:hypothetical protein
LLTDDPQDIFDRAFKRLMYLSDGAVINFINGRFGTAYPLDSAVAHPSTESITDELKRRVCDMIIVIENDSYLIEAQIDDDGNMAIRIFNYGYQYALMTKTIDRDGAIVLELPCAQVMYWEATKQTPDRETVRIKIPDGTHIDYVIESFKPLEHSIAELGAQKMGILLPFFMLKLRKQVQAAKSGDERKRLSEELKLLVQDLEQITEQSVQNGDMTKADKSIVISIMKRLYDHLYKKYNDFVEVKTMVDDIYWTDADKMMREAEEARKATWQEAREATWQEAREVMEKDHIEFARSLINDGFVPEIVAKYSKLDLDTVKALY